MSSLGAQLKAARERRGETQTQAAKLLFTTYKSVGEWERGLVEPQGVNAERIRSYVAGQQIVRPDTALQDAAFAAMVLSKIAQDAEQIARRAREAHGLLTQGDTAPSPTPDVDAAEAAALRQPPAVGRRRRSKG